MKKLILEWGLDGSENFKYKNVVGEDSIHGEEKCILV